MVKQNFVSNYHQRSIKAETSRRSKTLHLLVDGYLTFQQVFDRDAPYGVFTGLQIMDDCNIEKTVKKFNKVFALFDKVYAAETAKNFIKYFPNGKVITHVEKSHQTLLKIDGGESESSSDEYSSDDDIEETDDIKEIILGTRNLSF